MTRMLGERGFQCVVTDKSDKREWEEGGDIALVWEHGQEHECLPLLEDIRLTGSAIPAVVVLPRMVPEQVITATRLGAIEVLFNPIDRDRLFEAIGRAAAICQAHEGGGTPCDEMPAVLGESPSMLEVFKQLGVAAANHLNVLIGGETGVGKEVASFCIHKHSARSEGPFVAINCAALSENLIEAELFGHARGAFTGSVRDVPGKVEVANGGTLLLDEVGDLPQGCQAKLLRFLEDRTFYRLGESVQRMSDVRIVAATNRNLVADVQAGRFREDLYYRLAQITLVVPPLRERVDDIPALVRAFVGKANVVLDLQITGVSKAAMDAACRYHWSGNVRQLKNVVFQAAIRQRAGTITAFNFCSDGVEPAENAGNLDGFVRSAVSRGQVRSLLGNLEAMALKTLLNVYEGNRSRISAELGISRNTLRSKLREYGIDDDAADLSDRSITV
ncbi:MAG: sigma-54 dependent transcriptional regulator [Gammaproteobacteria bacterium]|nr:sigma-54 dependent transcriptional regulator [Gammaproteobacteria bacterium]